MMLPLFFARQFWIAYAIATLPSPMFFDFNAITQDMNFRQVEDILGADHFQFGPAVVWTDGVDSVEIVFGDRKIRDLSFYSKMNKTFADTLLIRCWPHHVRTKWFVLGATGPWDEGPRRRR